MLGRGALHVLRHAHRRRRGRVAAGPAQGERGRGCTGVALEPRGPLLSRRASSILSAFPRSWTPLPQMTSFSLVIKYLITFSTSLLLCSLRRTEGGPPCPQVWPGCPSAGWATGVHTLSGLPNGNPVRDYQHDKLYARDRNIVCNIRCYIDSIFKCAGDGRTYPQRAAQRHANPVRTVAGL